MFYTTNTVHSKN